MARSQSALIRLIGRDNHGIEPHRPPASTPPPEGAGVRAWFDRAADRIVPGNPARVVYGVVAVGALLAAESGSHESYADTVGSALIAIGIYWLAHSYASALGRRLAVPGRLTVSTLTRALAEEAAIVKGASIPLFALLIAWAAGAAQETAVTVALWTSLASLIAFELAAGVRSRATRGELALEVGVGLAMGLAIVALKVTLHH
jgi:hypothetical protein